MRYLTALLLLLSLCFGANAQIGGESTYEFLSLPTSARATAMGGSLIHIRDGDLGLATFTPSLLNASMHNKLSTSTVAYPGGINYGNVSYARTFGDVGTFQAGLQYMAYGSMPRTLETGQQIGTFSAGEYALYVGGAREYQKYSYGANVKLIYSQLGEYNSFGATIDLSGSYQDTAKGVTASLLVKNIGSQFKSYNGNYEGLPFDIQIGISKRLENAPFLVSITAHNLFRYDIRYDDPNDNSDETIIALDTNSVQKEKTYVFDKVMRHFILGTEIYLGKALTVNFAYNHLKRQELKLDTKTGLAGFSFGFGLKIKQFRLNYGFGKYHLAGGSHHFSILTDLSGFKKTKSASPQGSAASF